MDPKNNQHQRGQSVKPGDRPGFSSSSATTDQPSPQQATADLIRGQLDSIYAGGSSENTPHTTPAPQQTANVVIENNTLSQSTNPQTPVSQPNDSDDNTSISDNTPPNHHGLRTAPPEPMDDEAGQDKQKNSSETSTYQRTMDTNLQPQQPTKEQWQQYHSAWQRYYQLYYERYYLNSLAKQQEIEAIDKENPQDQQPKTIGSATESQTISQKEAMKELRESIRQKVIESSEKAKKSRHFKPILAGIGVLLIFAFLQYNTVLMGAVAAYVSPGNIDPQNIIVDTSLSTDVDPEPRMIIPKINVDAPVVYGIGPDHNSQMEAMKSGIAHFAISGANAVPGQNGNAVFAAHSSNDVFASGDYKFIFAQNEKLTKGDVIYMNYESKRYTYAITSMEVVLPSEVSRVQVGNDKPMLTLISCVPLGTAQKRLLVFAEQINPDPNSATEASEADEGTPSTESIPGQPAPSIFERLFGARR